MTSLAVGTRPFRSNAAMEGTSMARDDVPGAHLLPNENNDANCCFAGCDGAGESFRRQASQRGAEDRSPRPSGEDDSASCPCFINHEHCLQLLRHLRILSPPKCSSAPFSTSSHLSPALLPRNAFPPSLPPAPVIQDLHLSSTHPPPPPPLSISGQQQLPSAVTGS